MLEDAARIDEILGHGCLNVLYVPVRDKYFLSYSATCIFMSKLPLWVLVWCILWANTNLSEAHWVASGCHLLLDISAQKRGLGCLARSVPRNALLFMETWSWTGSQGSQTGWGHCRDLLLSGFSLPVQWDHLWNIPDTSYRLNSKVWESPSRALFPSSGHAASPGWLTGSTSYWEWGTNQLSQFCCLHLNATQCWLQQHLLNVENIAYCCSISQSKGHYKRHQLRQISSGALK